MPWPVVRVAMTVHWCSKRSKILVDDTETSPDSPAIAERIGDVYEYLSRMSDMGAHLELIVRNRKLLKIATTGCL